MVEVFLRARAAQLQFVYDRVPHPLQEFLTSARGWFLARIRYAGNSTELLRQLRSHESWTPQQIAEYQLQALQNVIDHARQTTLFYSHYPALRLNVPEDLAQLPVLARDKFREGAATMVSRQVADPEIICVSTTGTTGASVQVMYTREEMRRTWAFRMQQRAWAGVRPRDPRVTFFGSRVIPASRDQAPYWTCNRPERQLLMSIFHLSEQTAGDYIDVLWRHRGEVLEGFPSVLGIMADFILARGNPVPMRVVFTDGEPLYPVLREKVEKAFATRVFDSYGNTEMCGLIQQCEQGQMHLAPEFAFLEILDGENRPVPTGEEGYLVWTSFVNRTMPLIRYRIGDRGCWQAGGPCPCGRAFPRVVPTITRESDLLHCSDGRIFSPRALNQVLKEAASFRFCQFVQDGPDRVVVRAVPRSGDAAGDLARIQRELEKILGGGMQVTSVLASEPIVRAGGKIPLIVKQGES